MKKTKKIREVEVDLGPALIQGLSEIVEGLSRVSGKITIRHCKVAPPPVVKSKQIVLIREQLHMSQNLFAEVVGVSPQLVRAWEQGTRKPSRMACRLLEEIRQNPGYWRGRSLVHGG